MGIFNEQSNYQHPFAKVIQGAPGVGFNLTSDGNYDMRKKKMTNLAGGTDPNDGDTKKNWIVLVEEVAVPPKTLI